MNSEKFQKIGLFRLLKNIFTIELVILLLWIPCVIIIFRFIQNRKIAGLVAGTGFLLIPIFNLYREREYLNLHSHTSSRLVRVFASAVFFLLSAMPIFLFRVFNWEQSLEEISIFGILSGRQLHSLSNFLFVGMILIYLITNIGDAIKAKKTAPFKAP